MQPNSSTLMTLVRGRVKAHMSSQKNLSEKEAELVLVGKEDGCLTCYHEIKITNSRILGTLLYVFTYLFQIN